MSSALVPGFVRDHIAAISALRDGWASAGELVAVHPKGDTSGWNTLVGTPEGYRTCWVRLPRQGPVPAKRHNRADVPGDGATLDTLFWQTR
jgi:hypothetical protein